MKTFALTASAVFVLALGGAAHAQYRPGYPGGYQGGMGGYGGRPSVSPYLNLLGRGNPAINYYGIVRPQMAYDNALLGGAGAGPMTSGEELTDPELRRATGHSVAFNNLSHFYNNNPAMGGGMGGGFGASGGGAARFNTAGGAGASANSGAGAGAGRGYGGARGGVSTPGLGGVGPTIR